MRSIVICQWEYNPIYSLSKWFWSKVYLSIDVTMYGSFGWPFLSMNSTISSQCLKSVHEAWSYLGDRTISLPFNTQQITTMNVIFGTSGNWILAVWPTPSRNRWPVACCLTFPVNSAPECLLVVLSKTINPQPPNPSSITETTQRKLVLQCCWKISNSSVCVEASISKLVQTVLPSANGPMLLL